MERLNCRWDYCGRLKKADQREDGGTYLFVFVGDPKRIIYVGTAVTFKKRWDEHLSLFRQGARAVWRVTENEDVYKLMAQDERYESRAVYSQMLAEYLRLWVPASPEVGFEVNYYNKEDRFEQNWSAYVRDYYLPRIAVYACPIDDMAKTTVLETQIQRALGNRFNLGYWKGNSQNWLGKQEAGESVGSIVFQFENLPDLDRETREVLQGLHHYI